MRPIKVFDAYVNVASIPDRKNKTIKCSCFNQNEDNDLNDVLYKRVHIHNGVGHITQYIMINGHRH